MEECVLFRYTRSPAISSNDTPTPPSTISSKIKEANFESTPLMVEVFRDARLLPAEDTGVAALLANV